MQIETAPGLWLRASDGQPDWDRIFDGFAASSATAFTISREEMAATMAAHGPITSGDQLVSMVRSHLRRG